ncbi:MAG TPA: hypothetical protein VMR37_06900, partial [Rhabdochlamydiaceae bacterium]|nr:hypothetical protein [Rhabdochlamydiaceae bacterium]
MAVIPLKHQDISRIIDAFDQDNFKAPPLKSLPYARQLIVINQLERSLYLTFPAEIIDKIVRPFIESSPSIKILWMHFIGSPVIASKYNYPLASNTFLNSASKILLLKLGKTPSAEKEDLACFKQLMTEVFKHYFHKLSQPQKLELLQKCYITPWEQRSPEQQLVLLGRVQHLSGWGHPKIKLQFLSWKIRFAAARNLNNKVLKRIILAPLVIFFVLGSGILVLYLFHVINEGIFQNKKIENFLGQGVKTLAGGLLIHMICTLGVSVGGSVVSLFFAALGTILKNRSLPSHILP